MRLVHMIQMGGGDFHSMPFTIIAVRQSYKTDDDKAEIIFVKHSGLPSITVESTVTQTVAKINQAIQT